MIGGTERRVDCTNPTDGREFFDLWQHDRTVRIETPGALTRTYWNRDQITRLRDALDTMLRDWS